MLAHWARRTKRAVRGALLATPPDFEKPMPEGYPTMDALRAGGWLPVPRKPLPFPSIVGASRNDPLGRFSRVTALASDWGSEVVDLGSVGHLNPASGYGSGPRRIADRAARRRSTELAGRRRSPARGERTWHVPSASTRPAAPRCSSSRPSTSASPAPARRASATPTSRSTSSTSTSAPGAIRSRCRTGSAATPSASSRRSAKASPTFASATASAI
jgi:hypothetical protein